MFFIPKHWGNSTGDSNCFISFYTLTLRSSTIYIVFSLLYLNIWKFHCLYSLLFYTNTQKFYCLYSLFFIPQHSEIPLFIQNLVLSTTPIIYNFLHLNNRFEMWKSHLFKSVKITYLATVRNHNFQGLWTFNILMQFITPHNLKWCFYLLFTIVIIYV